MSVSVNPVNAGQPPTGSANGTVNARTLAAYEQLLALQTEEQIFLLDQGGASANTGDAVLATSDLLDLSPAALNILNGIDSASPTPGTTTTLTITGTLGQPGLSAPQTAQVGAIVSEFANQPATQQTFSQIDTALIQAGINPQQVTIQQLLEAYSYAYTPGFAFNGQFFTDTLAEELEAA